MKASVKVHRLNTFKHFFKACSIYGVSRFDVTPSNLNSKLSNSPPSIRFSDLTDFTEITEPVSPVPQELFQFRDYEQLQHIFQVTLSNSATPTLQSNPILFRGNNNQYDKHNLEILCQISRVKHMHYDRVWLFKLILMKYILQKKFELKT